MLSEPALVAFGLVVATGYAVQTTLGLGAMVLSVTFGAHLFPLHQVLALAVPLSVLQTGYVSLRHHDGIDFRLLLRRVLPLMGVGVVLGLFIGADIDRPWLRTAFALLVLGLALRELWVRLRGAPLASLPEPVAHAVMFSAGVVHGLFATGGPLLVYALGRRGLDKRALRSTLTAVWLTLNVFLCIAYARTGRFDRETLTASALLAPAVPIGIAVGERLHRRVDERRFQISVFVALAVAAAVLLARSLG